MAVSPTRAGDPDQLQVDEPYQIELKDIEAPLDVRGERKATLTRSASAIDREEEKAAAQELIDDDRDPRNPDNHVSVCGWGPTFSIFIIRLAVCALAIGLLWGTSLSVADAIVDSSVPSPAKDAVITRWTTTVSIAVEQSTQHEQCSTRQIAQCNFQLNSSLTALQIESNKAAARNKVQVYQAAYISNLCSDSYITLTDSITRWSSADLANNFVKYNEDICTASQINQVKTALKDVSQVQQQAFVLNQQHVRSQMIFADSAFESAKNRSNYDRDYLARKIGRINGLSIDLSALANFSIGNIMGDFDLKLPTAKLLSCLSLSDNLCVNGLRNTLQTVIDGFKIAYQQVLAVARANYQYALDFAARVGNVMTPIIQFFQYLRGIASLLPFSVGAIPDTFLPSMPINAIPFEVTPPDLSNVWEQVRHFVGDFNVSIAEIYAKMNLKMINLNVSINANLGDMPTLFEDYDPPPVELLAKQNKEAQQAESDQFISQSAVALKQIDVLPSVLDTLTSTNLSFTFLPNINFDTKLNFDFETLGGDFKLTPMLTAFYVVIYLLVIGDYIYRVSKSVRMAITYWAASHTALPTIDCRTHKTQTKKTRAGVQAAVIATHPVTIVAVAAIFIILVLSACAAAYIPLYEQYVEGCVESRRGTLLTNNSYSVTYNFASSSGNGILAEGLMKYDGTRGTACGASVQSSAKSKADDTNLITTSLDSQTLNRENLMLIQLCVNFTVFGTREEFNISSGYRDLPQTVISRALSTTSTPAGECTTQRITPYTVLEDSTFNCTLLEPCVPTCNGPDKQLVRSATHQSGCTTEWMIHAGVVRFFMTMLVYASLNLSRIWLIDGCLRYGWRSLTPPVGFTYMGTCSRSGKMSRNMDENVVKKLNIAIKNYERVAYVQFFLALFVHIPYIVVIAAVTGPFAYNP